MLRLGGGVQMRPLETSITSVWKKVRPIFLPETNSVSFLLYASDSELKLLKEDDTSDLSTQI